MKTTGDTVGELEFLFGIRHQNNARAGSSPATLFVLRKADYSQLIKLYPEDDEAARAPQHFPHQPSAVSHQP